MRRLEEPAIARAYGVEPERVYSDVKAQRELITRIFPDQIDGGKNPKTFDWMVSRTTDATGESAPREASLAAIWQVDEKEAGGVADRLVGVGFFSRSGDKSDPDYRAPFLYRQALSLVRGSAKMPDKE
jgi:hypothetical protein